MTARLKGSFDCLDSSKVCSGHGMGALGAVVCSVCNSIHRKCEDKHVCAFFLNIVVVFLLLFVVMFVHSVL